MKNPISKLSTLGDVLDEHAKKAERARQKWAEFIGTPFIFIPDENHEEHGVGFFRQGDSVLICRKFSNGYSHQYVQTFSRELIERLVATLNSPANPPQDPT